MKLPRLSQYLQEVGLTPDEIKSIRRDSMQNVGKVAMTSAEKQDFRHDTQSTFRRLLDADNPGSLVSFLKTLLAHQGVDDSEQLTVPSQSQLSVICSKINQFLNKRAEIKSDEDKNNVMADAIAVYVPMVGDAKFQLALSLALHKAWLIFDKSHVDQKFERSSQTQDDMPSTMKNMEDPKSISQLRANANVDWKAIRDSDLLRKFHEAFESGGPDDAIELLKDEVEAANNKEGLINIELTWRRFTYDIASDWDKGRSFDPKFGVGGLMGFIKFNKKGIMIFKNALSRVD